MKGINMSVIDGYDLDVYEDSEIKIVFTFHPIHVLVYVWHKGMKRFELGSWIPYYSISGNERIRSIDFLLKRGISFININSNFILLRIETKINNKFILYSLIIGKPLLGSIFNKHNNELKEDTQIYNYIKCLENKYK